jgi:iron(II)-dependent oxidoreductase
MHDLVVRDLGRARDRTLGLTDVDEPTLVAQHDPLMSPLVWDLAHVGQQEELWLLRGGDQASPGMLPPDVDALYDAFKHPAPSARRCRQGPVDPPATRPASRATVISQL